MLDVWVNGQQLETENVFVHNGTEIRFTFDNISAVLNSTSDSKKGVVHKLLLDGKLVDCSE